jgi:hypothetical protein
MKLLHFRACFQGREAAALPDATSEMFSEHMRGCHRRYLDVRDALPGGPCARVRCPGCGRDSRVSAVSGLPGSAGCPSCLCEHCLRELLPPPEAA